MADRPKDRSSRLGPEALAHRVRAANAGDAHALEEVVRAVQDDVYGIALRFLWHPQDAEDATQEILIRILTRLGTFREESSFRTWVYRVATSTLLNLRRSRAEESRMTFVEFGRDLEEGRDPSLPSTEPTPERDLLLEEVRVGCTLGMLLCLPREYRMAYILGGILELDHREGAKAMGISTAAFRQRLSRARRSLSRFMMGHCGCVNAKAACRCELRVAPAIEKGRVDPAELLHTQARRARTDRQALAAVRRLEEAQRDLALFRLHEPDLGETDFSGWVTDLIDRCLDFNEVSPVGDDVGGRRERRG